MAQQEKKLKPLHIILIISMVVLTAAYIYV